LLLSIPPFYLFLSLSPSPFFPPVLPSIFLLLLLFFLSHLQEEDDRGELLGFNAVASKLLAVVTAPIHSALVSRQPQVKQNTLTLSTLPVYT